MFLAGEDPPPECTVMGEKFFIQFLGSPYSPLSECTFGYERIYDIFLFLNLVVLVLVTICIRILITMHLLPLSNDVASTVLSTFLFFLFSEQIFLIAQALMQSWH